MNMKVLVFDLIGKTAHFRKFYTNSSSLSYYFPPRTTVAGIIAATLGLQRDSYYETFHENAFISVEIKTPLRKKTNVVNYLFVKSPSDVTGRSGGTQIPLEFVYPTHGVDNIIYRIFFHHEDDNIYNELKGVMQAGSYRFPIYLGITEMPARYVYVGEYEVEKLQNVAEEVTSVLRTDYLSEGVKLLAIENLFIDRMPATFENDRRVKRVSDYLFRPDGKTIKVTVKEVFKIRDLNSTVVPM
jgi:CRISPR-associated protein Cas5h